MLFSYFVGQLCCNNIATLAWPPSQKQLQLKDMHLSVVITEDVGRSERHVHKDTITGNGLLARKEYQLWFLGRSHVQCCDNQLPMAATTHSPH